MSDHAKYLTLSIATWISALGFAALVALSIPYGGSWAARFLFSAIALAVGFVATRFSIRAADTKIQKKSSRPRPL
jgi:hypothetical protein